MGVVWLAYDELLERHVAVKFIPTIDDDALTRFLVEARAAARVQHPNVATLYRVGQLEDRPYFIYELVRGTSLDRLDKPVDPAMGLRLGIDLTRGLAAAHRRGVLHRDIKPGNAILADSGEAKLLDFGVAKLLGPALAEIPVVPPFSLTESSSRSALSAADEHALRDLTGKQLLGTPYFMSPEAWRGHATERSDLFSLGLLLYELLAGKGPFRDVPLPELPRAVLDRDARPLRSAAPAVPEPFAAIIDRCVRRDPADRFATADDLLAALEAQRPSRAGAAVPEGNPYRGLRPFEPEHRAVFFGRQRALAQALDRLRVEPFLLVTGDSGVGKSSICAAGILPIASEGGLEDGRSWSIARLVPGRAPRIALAAALAPVIGATEDELEQAIRDDASALGRLARRRLRERDGLLVYLDQLEELVTLAPVVEAAQVAEAIAGLAAGLPGVRVLATARSDFLSRLEGLPGFSGRVSRALFLLAPLGRDEIREAIIGPAAVKQTRFEPEAMIVQLVDSTIAAQGAMPLLQFALGELWERRDVAAGVIRQDALDELGGVSGALSRHADGLVAALLPAERAAARALLLRLITAERTRARRLEDELVASSPHARPALEALVRGRLVVASESPEGTTYEIAHEALLEGWAALATWLAEDAERRTVLHRVETAAAEWRRHSQAREWLWSARQLGEAAALPAAELTSREHDFLEASRRASRRARWLRRAAVVVLLIAAVGIWVGAQIKERIERDDAIDAALDHAGALVATARRLDDDLRAQRGLAFAAFDQRRIAEAEVAWTTVLMTRDQVVDAYRDASEPLERALLLDGSRGDVRRRYAELLYERAVVADREGQPDERDELLRRMELYDDGQVMATRWAAPGRLDLVSEPAGARVRARRYAIRDGRRVLDAGVELGVTPLRAVELPPGSLMLELRAPGRAPVDYPVVLGRAETLAVTVPLPSAEEVPADLVWIAPGRTLIGSGDPESVRAFFKAVPAHQVGTAGYLIARHETTFADWLAYLDALPDDERERRTPRTTAAGAQGFAVAMRRLAPGNWELQLQPGGIPLVAQVGTPIRYPDRTVNAEQDWLRFPAVGISHGDAIAYAAWMASSGRLSGARLCTEFEWERAARGADDRLFPHGDVLAPADANVDETYGKNAATSGPDEVGLHPGSRSPFGLDDLAGNVWEWVITDATSGQAAARGGSFYYAATTARIANRETPEPNYRDISLGLRLCADLPSTRR